MKKINLTRVLFAALLISLSLLFVSCAGGELMPDGGFRVESGNAPIFKYDPETNTTDVLVHALFTNGTEANVSKATFYASFYDSSGNFIDSRLCRLASPIMAGESYEVYYRFAGEDRMELNAIDGEVKSVSFAPDRMELVPPLDLHSGALAFAKTVIAIIAFVFFAPMILHIVFFIRKKKISNLIYAAVHLVLTVGMVALYFLII